MLDDSCEKIHGESICSKTKEEKASGLAFIAKETQPIGDSRGH